MNKKLIEQILKEEIEAIINEEELDENFFKKMAAKLRGAKDGGWEAVAAQGDDKEPSSRLAGTPDQAKIPLRTLIGKLVTAGLPQEIAVELFEEIYKQLTTVHGFSKGSIKEQAGALKGVAAQPSARRTSNMPSRRGRSLDLTAVKIPKNMAPDVKNILQQMFSKFGLSDIRLGIGPPQERTATQKEPQPKPVKATPEPEKETPSRIDLLKPPRSMRDIKGSKNYKKFMASLLDFFANQMKIDIKIAKKIVRDIWAKTPTSGKFNKLVFKEQMEKEIDIAAILANSGLNPTQQIKVLVALKKWAAQNSDLIDDRMTQILRLRDKEEQKPQPAAKPQTADAPAGEEEAETNRVQPQPEPESTVSEPQATEEPLKIITKILGEKGVDEEKVSAFINDLREMGVIQEINSNNLRKKLKMNTAEWQQFSQKHKEVIQAIGALGGRRNTQLRNQFVNALSGIVIRKSFPRTPRGSRKKDPTAAPKSKNDSTPAATTPAEPAAQAAPEPAPEPAPQAAPEPEPTPAPESEPTQQEEEPKQKTADPNFTRRTIKRIKDYYNGLEIAEKLPHPRSFNNWKKRIERIDGVQSIEKQTFEGDNSLFVITLDDGQQFGLPKQAYSSSIEFAFEEEGTTPPGKVPLKNVLKLAKINDGKIEEKGLVDYGTKLNESLMARSKTIAGIK